MPEKPHYHGHRERLKEKFRKNGAESLLDYELLELLLIQAIPRRDVKPLAKELIAHFGGFNAVLDAPLEELSSYAGMGASSATSLKLVRGVCDFYRKQTLMEHPCIEDRLQLLDYLYTKMSTLPHEEFHVLYLNAKNGILSDEKLFRGTVDASAVYPREVAKMALKHGASRVILVHNHPSGDPAPSVDDDLLTAQVYSALKPLEIDVYDHIIIGKGRHYSFRDFGKI